MLLGGQAVQARHVIPSPWNPALHAHSSVSLMPPAGHRLMSVALGEQEPQALHGARPSP